MPDRDKALIVFAKIPAPNEVKTRLTTLLTPEEAAELYEAFLLDALEIYEQIECDVRLYLSPSELRVPPVLADCGASLHTQVGDGLGKRMAAAFAETFVEGYEKAVVIGTDHPTLPPSFVEQAFLGLDERYSISIGPSEDGGFYLLGMNEFYPQLFQEMSYSHDRVFEDTMDRASGLRASLYVLPMWYDVDTPDALVRLASDLGDSSLSLPRTRRVFSGLAEQYQTLRV